MRFFLKGTWSWDDYFQRECENVTFANLWLACPIYFVICRFKTSASLWIHNEYSFKIPRKDLLTVRPGKVRQWLVSTMFVLDILLLWKRCCSFLVLLLSKESAAWPGLKGENSAVLSQPGCTSQIYVHSRKDKHLPFLQKIADFWRSTSQQPDLVLKNH